MNNTPKRKIVRPVISWSYETCKAEARRHKTSEEWSLNEPESFNKAKELEWLKRITEDVWAEAEAEVIDVKHEDTLRLHEVPSAPKEPIEPPKEAAKLKNLKQKPESMVTSIRFTEPLMLSLKLEACYSGLRYQELVRNILQEGINEKLRKRLTAS